MCEASIVICLTLQTSISYNNVFLYKYKLICSANSFAVFSTLLF